MYGFLVVLRSNCHTASILDERSDLLQAELAERLAFPEIAIRSPSWISPSNADRQPSLIGVTLGLTLALDLAEGFEAPLFFGSTPAQPWTSTQRQPYACWWRECVLTHRSSQGVEIGTAPHPTNDLERFPFSGVRLPWPLPRPLVLAIRILSLSSLIKVRKLSSTAVHGILTIQRQHALPGGVIACSPFFLPRECDAVFDPANANVVPIWRMLRQKDSCTDYDSSELPHYLASWPIPPF